MSEITTEYLLSRISAKDFAVDDHKQTVICKVVLDNGWEIFGASRLHRNVPFDPNIGRQKAEAQAIKAMWNLFGFMDAEKRFLAQRA
jgi:hypothetical protein